MDLIEKGLLEERRELTKNYRSTESVWVKKNIREKIAAIDQELRKMILETTPIFHE
jgi:hypothetical protein